MIKILNTVAPSGSWYVALLDRESGEGFFLKRVAVFATVQTEEEGLDGDTNVVPMIVEEGGTGLAWPPEEDFVALLEPDQIADACRWVDDLAREKFDVERRETEDHDARIHAKQMVAETHAATATGALLKIDAVQRSRSTHLEHAVFEVLDGLGVLENDDFIERVAGTHPSQWKCTRLGALVAQEIRNLRRDAS